MGVRRHGDITTLRHGDINVVTHFRVDFLATQAKQGGGASTGRLVENRQTGNTPTDTTR